MITNDVQYRTTKTLLGSSRKQPETSRRVWPVRRTRSCTNSRSTQQKHRRRISGSRSPSTSNSGPARLRRSRPTRSATCPPCWSEPVSPGDGRSGGSQPNLGSRSNRFSVTRRTDMRPPVWPGYVRSPTHSAYASARPASSWPTRQRPDGLVRVLEIVRRVGR